MSTSTIVIIVVLSFSILPVFLSMVVESLRRPPVKPRELYWDKSIPIQYVNIDGVNIRFIKTGQGPNLVLLHTLRTQLDLFQKVIPELKNDFTVYALDYPGHGFSDIPQTDYEPGMFINTVEQFLEVNDINDAILAGISIGGSIALLIAARHNPRVKKVISINPYDYDKGMGIRRGNFVARLIFTLARIPVLGETVMRLRIPIVEKIIMQGGVNHPDTLPEDFLRQLWQSGIRKGHYRAFINLIRNLGKWEKARDQYTGIGISVVLVYGEKDWSKEDERVRNRLDIPDVMVRIVSNGGHFLSLDCPEELTGLIRENTL